MTPLAALLLAALPALGAGRRPPAPQAPAAAHDRRLELDAVVRRLARWLDAGKTFGENESALERERLARFLPLAQDPAVAFYRGGARSVYLTFPVLRRLDAGLDGDAGAENRAWIAALRTFAARSDFDAWFAEEASLVAPEIERWNALLGKSDHLRVLERYLGEPAGGRWTFYLSPYQDLGPANLFFPDAHGGVDIVTVLDTDRARAGRHRFDNEFDSDLGELLLHEGAHPPVERALEEHAALVQALPGKPPAACGDGSWKQCVIESAAQGVALRLLERRYGPEALARERARRAEHLPYLDAVFAKLAEYEAGRERYPTFAAFVPEFLTAFAASSER